MATPDHNRKRVSTITHNTSPTIDYNHMPINELINKIKVPGSKGFKILRELNEAQLAKLCTSNVSHSSERKAHADTAQQSKGKH